VRIALPLHRDPFPLDVRYSKGLKKHLDNQQILTETDHCHNKSTQLRVMEVEPRLPKKYGIYTCPDNELPLEILDSVCP